MSNLFTTDFLKFFFGFTGLVLAGLLVVTLVRSQTPAEQTASPATTPMATTSTTTELAE